MSTTNTPDGVRDDRSVDRHPVLRLLAALWLSLRVVRGGLRFDYEAFSWHEGRGAVLFNVPGNLRDDDPFVMRIFAHGDDEQGHYRRPYWLDPEASVVQWNYPTTPDEAVVIKELARYADIAFCLPEKVVAIFVPRDDHGKPDPNGAPKKNSWGQSWSQFWSIDSDAKTKYMKSLYRPYPMQTTGTGSLYVGEFDPYWATSDLVMSEEQRFLSLDGIVFLVDDIVSETLIEVKDRLPWGTPFDRVRSEAILRSLRENKIGSFRCLTGSQVSVRTQDRFGRWTRRPYMGPWRRWIKGYAVVISREQMIKTFGHAFDVALVKGSAKETLGGVDTGGWWMGFEPAPSQYEVAFNPGSRLGNDGGLWTPEVELEFMKDYLERNLRALQNGTLIDASTMELGRAAQLIQDQDLLEMEEPEIAVLSQWAAFMLDLYGLDLKDFPSVALNAFHAKVKRLSKGAIQPLTGRFKLWNTAIAKLAGLDISDIYPGEAKLFRDLGVIVIRAEELHGWAYWSMGSNDYDDTAEVNQLVATKVPKHYLPHLNEEDECFFICRDPRARGNGVYLRISEKSDRLDPWERADGTMMVERRVDLSTMDKPIYLAIRDGDVEYERLPEADPDPNRTGARQYEYQDFVKDLDARTGPQPNVSHTVCGLYLLESVYGHIQDQLAPRDDIVDALTQDGNAVAGARIYEWLEDKLRWLFDADLPMDEWAFNRCLRAPFFPADWAEARKVGLWQPNTYPTRLNAARFEYGLAEHELVLRSHPVWSLDRNGKAKACEFCVAQGMNVDDHHAHYPGGIVRRRLQKRAHVNRGILMHALGLGEPVEESNRLFETIGRIVKMNGFLGTYGGSTGGYVPATLAGHILRKIYRARFRSGTGYYESDTLEDAYNHDPLLSGLEQFMDLEGSGQGRGLTPEEFQDLYHRTCDLALPRMAALGVNGWKSAPESLINSIGTEDWAGGDVTPTNQALVDAMLALFASTFVWPTRAGVINDNVVTNSHGVATLVAALQHYGLAAHNDGTFTFMWDLSCKNCGRPVLLNAPVVSRSPVNWGMYNHRDGLCGDCRPS